MFLEILISTNHVRRFWFFYPAPELLQMAQTDLL